MESLVKKLLNHDLYSARNKEVFLKQTHISYVIMTDEFVYKIKKPVKFSFLDFSTLQKRKYYCEKELELNKRLSPDVYLEVIEIKEKNGTLNYGETGKTVEYCVKMKRIPEDKMMINLLHKNALHHDDIRKIAKKISDFHQKADSNDEIAKFGTMEAIRKNINGNYEYAEKYIDKTLSKEVFLKIKQFTDDFLPEKKKLFLNRIKEQKIKDCHGDMHMQHICLGDDIYIYDCIEFNDRFRYCDTASETAFLAMDLDFHGRSNLSNQFINDYVEFSEDTGIRELLNFYKCYRACVRGKVNSLELDDHNLSLKEKEEARITAEKYFDLAMRYTGL